MLFPEMSGPITFEFGELLSVLSNADLIDIRYGDQGMLCGNILLPKPRVITPRAVDEEQAWATNHAKEALGRGDRQAALDFLVGVSDETRRKH